MPDVGRYVVADSATMLIVGGPYAWDGVTPWTPPELEGSPPESYALMTESAALAGGYSYPPPPPPVEEPEV